MEHIEAKITPFEKNRRKGKIKCNPIVTSSAIFFLLSDAFMLFFDFLNENIPIQARYVAKSLDICRVQTTF